MRISDWSSDVCSADLSPATSPTSRRSSTGPTARRCMTMSQQNSPTPKAHHEEVESYGGHIQARHGRVDAWLLVVYFVLFVWALYYGYRYWGGLGPGLDY